MPKLSDEELPERAEDSLFEAAQNSVDLIHRLLRQNNEVGMLEDEPYLLELCRKVLKELCLAISDTRSRKNAKTK